MDYKRQIESEIIGLFGKKKLFCEKIGITEYNLPNKMSVIINMINKLNLFLDNIGLVVELKKSAGTRH